MGVSCVFATIVAHSGAQNHHKEDFHPTLLDMRSAPNCAPAKRETKSTKTAPYMAQRSRTHLSG